MNLVTRTINISAFILCAAAVPLTASAAPTDFDVPRILRDIEYARPDGISLKLDVFLPEATQRPAPVVVFVHGGGWKNGSKKSGEKNAAWLTQDGIAVVSIDYRLTNVAQWPAQINDCYEAVRWVRKNADTYGFDPDNVGAWGTSAGAHLVALMATRRYVGTEKVSSRIQAACDWFGPADLLTMPPNVVGNGRTQEDVANSNGAKLLGATVRDVPDLAKDASAFHNVSGDDCPFLIMHGDSDTGVPLLQSQRLHRELCRNGVPSELSILKGAGHGGKQFQTHDSRAIVRTFFSRHLQRSWLQAAGGSADFYTADAAPTKWSVANGQNINWKVTLPETGQSTIAVWGNRLYFTTMEEVTEDAELGQNVVAWCCDVDSGTTIWKRSISGSHPLRLSGCFSDSSAPAPVTNGRQVVFFNASGRISCFDNDGNQTWTKEMMPVGRSQPFLVGNNVVFTRQKYMPVEGHFTHEHKDASAELWTNLQALRISDGSTAWTSSCGVNMGCIPLPLTLSDGRRVILVGRGGGHSPPEKPEGVSMVDAGSGETIWTLPLPGFMSTQTYGVHGEHALIFHGDRHLWVNVRSGEIDRQISITSDVAVRAFKDGHYVDATMTLPASKRRSIIQQSNLLVGKYHYFRSYTHPFIGRINAESGAIEYLQVPVQFRRDADGVETVLWDESQMAHPIAKDKKQRPFGTGTMISYVAFDLNDIRNSRGFVVMGDARSQGNGWGHHAAAIPSAAGKNVYFPIMSGMVYVLKHDTPYLNEQSLVAINDLGELNRTWTRSSLAFARGRIFARTIRELICIGD